MNRTVAIPAVLSIVFGGCVAGAEIVDPRLKLGEEVYVACGACHLPTGEGVVGAFPPVRNRIAAIAATDAGREYLAAVVLDGLMGSIYVDGAMYAGFMQQHRLSLDDDQVSAVLNFVMLELTDSPVDAKPFSAAEIAAVRAQPGSAQNSAALREALGLD